MMWRVGTCAAALVIGFMVGHQAGRSGGELRALRAEKKGLEDDAAQARLEAKAASDAFETARQENESLAALHGDLEKQVKDYADAIEKQKADAEAAAKKAAEDATVKSVQTIPIQCPCDLDDDDVGRLRKLGQSSRPKAKSK